jgi:hypothetical protein
MTRGEAKRLRAELELQSRRRERRRYPAALRERAVSYALRGWRWRRGSGFRPVEMIVPTTTMPAAYATTMHAAHATTPVERVVVTTPRGLRIEGLDDLVRLVAELG